MTPIETRAEQASLLWQQGMAAEAMGDLHRAYALFTEAHDLVIDCANLHRKAHEHLRGVNLKLGNVVELATDWALHCFAPLGVFELVAYFAKSDAARSVICRQRG